MVAPLWIFPFSEKVFSPNQRTSLPFPSIFYFLFGLNSQGVCVWYYPTNFQRMSCNFRDTKAGEKISLKFLFFRIREFHRATQKDIRLAHNRLKCRLDVPQLLYLHFGIWFPLDFESSDTTDYRVYFTFLLVVPLLVEKLSSCSANRYTGDR